jgi:probable F420-dependent oxidoreductase
MTIDIGNFGIWRRVGQIDSEMAREAETLGFGAIWVGGSPPGDLLAVERVLDDTEHIPVITGIVNMWREAPGLVAEAHLRIRGKHPGRFILGVGIGHPESTAEYTDPLARINRYLDEILAAGVEPDEIILAALGPKALRISAERTAGAHPYLTTPRHTSMARKVLGSGPLLAPEHFVILGGDDRARQEGRKVVARYLALDNYRRNLLREGWDPVDLENGGSDRLVDALVLHGTTDQVAAGLRSHLDAGADHVSIQVVDGSPSAGHRELAAELLG